MALRLPIRDKTPAHLAHLAPFAAQEIGFVPIGKTGLVALHVFLDAVQDRLTAVDGPDGWAFTTRRIDDFAVVGTLTIRGVVRESIGFGTTAAAREASALKRAAARHGIGRYLARTRRIIKPVGVGTLELQEGPSGRLIVGETLEQALRDDYTATSLPDLIDRYGAPLARDAREWTPPECEAPSNARAWAARLAAPFVPAAVRWMVVEQHAEQDPPYGIVAPYVARVTYEDRLDAALTAAGWDCTIAEWGPASVTVAVTINGVTRHGIGDGNNRYLQEARAFKRACKQHGVARYLARHDLGMRHTLRLTGTPDGLLVTDGGRWRIGQSALATLNEHYAHALVARIEKDYGPALDHHDRPEQFGDEADAGEDLAASSGTSVNAAALVRDSAPAASGARRFGIVIGEARPAEQDPGTAKGGGAPPLRLATPTGPAAAAAGETGQPDARAADEPTTGTTAHKARPPAAPERAEPAIPEAAEEPTAAGASREASAPEASDEKPTPDVPEEPDAADGATATATEPDTATTTPAPALPATEDSPRPDPDIAPAAETLVDLQAPPPVIDAMHASGIPDPLAARLLRTILRAPDGQLEFSDSQLDATRTVTRTIEDGPIDAADVAALLATAERDGEDAEDRCTKFCASLLQLADERRATERSQPQPDPPDAAGDGAEEAPAGTLEDQPETGAPAPPSALDADRLQAAHERLCAEADAAAATADAAFDHAINQSDFTDADVQRIFEIVTGIPGNERATPEQTEEAAEIIELGARLRWDSGRLNQVLDKLVGQFTKRDERRIALIGYLRREVDGKAA